MPDQFLSLLDITARRGSDAAVGLVEEVVNYAPELEKIMGRPIPNTYYTAKVRTAYTAQAAFRKANAGVSIGSSNYEQKRFDTFFFDAQLQVDELDGLAAEGNGDSLAELQTDEAIGAVRAKAILLGRQLYQGTLNDPLGFPGLIDMLTTQQAIKDPITNANIDQVVDAGGTSTTACQVVWYIWMHQQGVHFLFGGNQGIDVSPWTKQQVKDANSKSFMAWVANVKGFIGASWAHIRAVGCVKNVDCTITNGAFVKPWTDAQDLQLWGKFPVGIKPNLCFASRAAVSSLQASRQVTIFANSGSNTSKTPGVTANVAPRPIMTASGIPIVETDSIIPGKAF